MCDQNSCMHAKCQNQMNQFLSLGFMVLTGMHVLYHKFEHIWPGMVDAHRTWLFLSSVCVFHPVDISEIQQIT